MSLTASNQLNENNEKVNITNLEIKNVSYPIKKKMVTALSNKSSEDYKNRIKIDIVDLNFTQKTVADFVNHKSIDFFNILKIPTEFLKSDPEDWENMPDYQLGLSVVRNMKVVNDFAERGVALIQNYNSILTKNESQKQFLLQVVESHRKRFTDARKSTIISDEI